MPEPAAVRSRVADKAAPGLGQAATSARQVRPAVAALMLGLLVAELDQTLFAASLPTIAGDLGASSQLFWITGINVLAGVVVMPVLGRLGDDLGRPNVFIAALSVLIVGSVVGGLAANMPVLLMARALQGLGGGGLIVLVQAMVADVVAPRRRAAVFSVIGAVFALAAVAGPVLGGWVTETLGWRWAFWLNLPLGAFAVAVACRFLHPAIRTRPVFRLPMLNLAAMVVCAGGATVLVSWASSDSRPTWPAAVGVPAAALAGGAAFVVLERRSAHPLLPLALLKFRDYRVAVAAGFLLALALFGPLAYLPTYLQMAQGLSPTQAGMLMLTLMAGLGLATIGAARVVARTGRPKWLPIVGAGTGAVALVLLSRLHPGSSVAVVGIELTMLGLGIGCAWEVLVVIAQSSVPGSEVGAATAGNGFFREIGVLGGTTAVGAVFVSAAAARLADQPLPAGVVSWSSLTPERMATLPTHLHTGVAEAYNGALTPVFAALVPVALAAAVLLLLLRPVRLAFSQSRGARLQSSSRDCS